MSEHKSESANNIALLRRINQKILSTLENVTQQLPRQTLQANRKRKRKSQDDQEIHSAKTPRISSERVKIGRITQDWKLGDILVGYTDIGDFSGFGQLVKITPATLTLEKLPAEQQPGQQPAQDGSVLFVPGKSCYEGYETTMRVRCGITLRNSKIDPVGTVWCASGCTWRRWNSAPIKRFAQNFR